MGEFMDSSIDMYSGDGLEKLLYTVSKFMVGTLSADSDWDGFIGNIEKLQIKKVTDIYQKAYERQFKK